MQSFDEMNDRDLEKMAFSGDFDAYEHLLKRHAASLFIVAYAISRSRSTADALVSATVSITWHQVKAGKQREDLVTALFHNMMLHAKRLRRAGGADAAIEPSAAVGEPDDLTPSSNKLGDSAVAGEHVQVMRSNRADLMETLISQMSFEHSVVFLLNYIAEQPIAEIAKYISRTEKTTSRRLDEMLNAVAKEMGEGETTAVSSFIRKHFSKEKEYLSSVEMSNDADAAVQKGLLHAGQGVLPRHRNKKIWAWTLGVSLGVVVLAIIVLNPFREKETHASLNLSGTRVVPDESLIYSTASSDGDYRSRVADGDYKKLGYAMKLDDGSRLIIDGAIDYGRETLLMYTLEKREPEVSTSIVDGSILERSTLLLLGYLQNQMVLEETEKAEKGFVTFVRTNPTVSTEGALLQFEVEVQGDEAHTVMLETDYPHEVEQPAKEIALDESFTIEGQTYHITGLTISSDYTRVKMKPDIHNEKGIESLKNVRLDRVRENSRSGSRVVEIAGDDLIFPSIYYEDSYEELQLTLDEELFSLETPFVIDLNNLNLVQYPKGMEPESFGVTYADPEIDTLFHTIQFPVWEGIQYEISDYYTDAAGQVYTAISNIFDGDNVNMMIPDLDYEQPLTFYFSILDQDQRSADNNLANYDPLEGRISVPLIINPQD
ncbi:RNA polymerase sigma factor [Paenibacillus shunpengii]|uniref:RNA polymerase sigma factor n=1 Tax=Paenibacillus shunpengii TaxID=2054424 RepID=A0ABW5SQP7_9BACL